MSAPEAWSSRTVKELVAGSSLQFSGRGAYSLKGIPGEWRLLPQTESVRHSSRIATQPCRSLPERLKRAAGFTPAAGTPRLAVRRNRHRHRWRSRLAMRLAVSCTLLRRFFHAI